MKNAKPSFFKRYTLAHGLATSYDHIMDDWGSGMRLLYACLFAMLGGCASRVDTVLKPHPVPVKRYTEGSAKYSEDFASHYVAVLHFSLDGHALDEQDASDLKRIAKQLQDNPDLRVYVDGYTCELGGSEYNMALGYKRAQTVSDYLIKEGAGPDQLVLLSYGKEKPVDQRHLEDAWKKNRRVEVHLVETVF